MFRERIGSVGMELILKESIRVNDDETKLSQVLINLLSNALRFTENGFVKLVVFVPDIDKHGMCKIRFKVTDSGIGIDKAY
jgi:signal transduction histidine kinase